MTNLPVIEIVSAAGPVLVQDGGRPGRMHEGIPAGGPLVPELHAVANVSVGNPPAAAALEIWGALQIVVREAPTVVAVDDGGAETIPTGEIVSVAPSRARVRYLAVRGGLDVPVVLGGRGTLLVARFGGAWGRPLRRGDRLRAASSEGAPAPTRHPARVDLGWDDPIRVVPGPDLDRFAPDALESFWAATFRVSAVGDRVGVRLEGPAIRRRPGAEVGVSAPMAPGAIQVPASGEPIVLGPDHPTTGGYPVLAVVTRADLGRFLSRRPGSPVVFTPVEAARRYPGGPKSSSS